MLWHYILQAPCVARRTRYAPCGMCGSVYLCRPVSSSFFRLYVENKRAFGQCGDHDRLDGVKAIFGFFKGHIAW